MRLRHGILLVLCLFVLFPACKQHQEIARSTVRLVDLIQPASLSKSTTKLVDAPQRTEWRFDGKDKGTSGWEAISDISKLEVREGRLSGRTTGALPILHLQRSGEIANGDLLHSIEIRMRASAPGSNVAVKFASAEKFNPEEQKEVIRSFPSLIEKSPLLAGEKIQTYTLRPKLPVTGTDIRHIILIPIDRSGADFEIESVRLIFRKEYLSSIPSGVSWQGLKGIFQETIVARSPETLDFDLNLPSRAWLDLNLGTIEDSPVTFRISASSGGTDRLLLERTISRPHRWNPVALELPAAGSGQKTQIRLSVISDSSGKMGFWGSPVIRSHGALPVAAKTEKKVPQGVIVIWTDTLRRDHLDAYGYPRATAPHVKEMAKNGAIFQNAVSQATWTKVASPTLITSLYPATHGVREFTDRLPSSATTMVEIFQLAGYATIGFSSNLFTATFSNFHQGFEQLHEDSSLPNPDSSKTTREYMDRLLPWLDQHTDVPFFVFLHAYDAHDPYEPYAPYNTMWADPSKKEEYERNLSEARKIITDPLMKAFGMPTREEMVKARINPDFFVSQTKNWYDGSIREMDTEIGRLIEHLRNLHLDRQTIVVLAGDHGEEFLEHGRMFHGQSVYSELTNVPLIFWGPGIIPAGLEIPMTVETVDVMPTILEVAGLKSPSGIQGHSFVNLLNNTSRAGEAEAGSDARSEPAFSEKAITSDSAAPAPHDTESYSVVLDGWKLIQNSKRHEPTPEMELYQLSNDPFNLVNVADQHPEVVNRLRPMLQQWRAKTDAARLKSDSDSAKGLSQEELERLRSLGYIQ